MIPTWLHKRSTISSTCEVTKIFTPPPLIPPTRAFKRPPPNLPMDSPGGGGKNKPHNRRPPGGRRQQTGQNLDGRGFPAPVRSKKAEELPRRHAQIDIVDRSKRAEATRKLLCHNGQVGHRISPGLIVRSTTLA